MIVSYHEGRVRLRFKQLQNPLIATMVQKRMNSIEGVLRVEIKTNTGSALIEYNPDILSTQQLFTLGKTELAKYGLAITLPDVVSDLMDSQ